MQTRSARWPVLSGVALVPVYKFEEVAQCNMCGSDRFRLVGLRLNGRQGMRPRSACGIAVSIVRCGDCGLIFPNPMPRPERLTDHYDLPPADYWHNVPVFDPRYMAEDIAVMSSLHSGGEQPKALDVGAGLGNAMRALELAGYEAWGFEPAPQFRQHALSQGLAESRLALAGIEEVNYPEQSFDVITFGAVLEHLYDPSGSLEKALSWLRPGGIIHAEVPSCGHLMTRIANAYFRLWGTNFVSHVSPMHPPFHIYEFTQRTFERNGARLGYEIALLRRGVGEVLALPRITHGLLKKVMGATRTGMQMTVFLRKSVRAAI